MKLLSERANATITDADQIRIGRILDFWFKEHELSAPQIDGRMDIWFGEDESFDNEVENTFADEVDEASHGRLDHWTRNPEGCLALILLLDQFRRNIYRGSPEAFSMDKAALKICVEGAIAKRDRELTPIQRVFFYMPLQHAESRKVQKKSVEIYRRLAQTVSPTYRETFETVTHFAELHHDIIERFGRFPHRNKMLKRKNTPDEQEFLANDGPTFGQGG